MPPATRRRHPPRLALAALVASVGLVGATAALGPSAVEPPLPGGAGLPPYAVVGLRPPDTLVVSLLVAAVALGTLGLGGAWTALRRGWAPRVRRLVALGALAAAALSLVPPVGSADPESYAAYGHIAATGHDPYAVTPAQAYRDYDDRVAAAVERPWQNTPSVYGPLATAEQTVAAGLGDHSVRTTVAVLAWLNAAAFLVTGLLLLLLAPTDAARRRAALLWLANPLLLLELVAGAHVDALVALAAVAAVALARLAVRAGRAAPVMAAGAGAALAAAASVKLTAGFIGLGLLWALRHRPRLAAAATTTAVAGTALGYGLSSPHVLDQTRVAARYVSGGTPWRWLASLLDHTVGQPTSRSLLGALAAAAVVGLLALFLRPTRAPARRAADATTLAATALATFLAYLLATPYLLPWYTAPAWALLAVAPRRRPGPDQSEATTVRFGALLLAVTGALAAAYLTRDQPLAGGAHGLVLVLRSVVAPVAVAASWLVAVVTAWPRRAAVTPG